GAAWASRDGAVNARQLPALVQLRARSPAGSGVGRVDPASLVGRRGTRPRAPGDRHRLLHRGGTRLSEAGCRLRLHRRGRLPPDPRDPLGLRRGVARPLAQGAGWLGTRRASLRARAGRPGASRWRRRRAPDPRRRGLLEQAGAGLPRREGLPLLGRGDDAPSRGRADRPDPRGGLAACARLPRHRRLRARRDHAGKPAARRPPRASSRPGGPDRAVRLLATLRLRDQPRRGPAHGRPRASAARRGRARDPRSQRPGTGPLSFRPLRRKRRLDGDRVPGPQPPALTGMLGVEDATPRTARTIRRRLLAIPGRLTRTARQWTLHLPDRWPWQRSFIEALTRIRTLPAAA